MTPPLILASQSPRRRAFFQGLGLPFTIHTADIDETPLPAEKPDVLVCRLSKAKAEAVAARHPDALIVAADTIVALDNQVLGKPASSADAVAMLKLLRGQTHQVYSAVTVLNRGTGQRETILNCNQVTMRAYTNAEIEAYVATGDPLDKAGAYAIQHAGFQPVAQLDGCFAGVMGFPLAKVTEVLRAFGVPLAIDTALVCRRVSGQRCCLKID